MFKPLDLEKFEQQQQQENEKNINNNNNNFDVKYKTPESTNLLSPNTHQQITRSHSFGNGAVNGSADKNGEEKSRLAMSLSQPLLNNHGVEKKPLKTVGSGTLDRHDIFYTGSLHKIANHRSQHSVHTELDRYGSLKGRSNDVEVNDRKEICGCIPCSQETKDTIKKMMSFGLLKDPIFLLFVASNFMTR